MTKFVSMVGLTAASALMSLPSLAQQVQNSHANIFNETPYNHTQRVHPQLQYQPARIALTAEKNSTKPKRPTVQPSSSGVLNSQPSIFNEAPYNRGKRPSAATPVTSPPATDAPNDPNTNTPGTSTPVPTTSPTPTPVPTTSPTSKPVPTTSPTSKPVPRRSPVPQSQGTKNLIAVAESNGSFTTLVKALKAAGLTETLQGSQPFTIFAPTDEAFAKLPQDALQDLLKPENKEVLVKVLTYHVVKGKVLAKDLKSGDLKSLQGDPIAVKVDQDGVTVNNVKVTKPDIQASNGVIHQIDEIILPPSL
jgi:uncharacterized surface protein with fasciclin (FAS1) repeats